MRDLSCDVVVVGGGIAGVSIAATIAEERRVVLVEAEPLLAYHSTGRSAAAYLPSYGGPVVRVLTAASRILFDEMAAARDSPLLTAQPLLWVFDDGTGERAVAALETESGVLRVDGATAHSLCPALRPERILGGGLDEGGMQIDVAGLHEGYVRRLRQRGATVLTSAGLQSIRREATGWEVAAGDRRIRAVTVVDAAGAWADQVAEMAGVAPVGLSPRLRSAFISPVRHELGDRRGWPLVSDVLERWYFKADAGGVLVSPADERPSDPGDARPDELEIARAIEELNDVTTLELRSVSAAWAGLRSFVSDHAPVVGARQAEPGFFFFAGQGGYGIQMGPALAELGASLLLTGSVPRRLAEVGIAAADVSPERPGL